LHISSFDIVHHFLQLLFFVKTSPLTYRGRLIL
jgi:hypothetical protein